MGSPRRHQDGDPTVTNISDRGERYVASVKAPAGFTATVKPSSMTVPPGASKSFTVTPDPDHGDSRRLGVRVADLDRWPRPLS